MLPGPPPLSAPNWPAIHCASGCPSQRSDGRHRRLGADDLQAEGRGLPEIDVRDPAVVERDGRHLADVARPHFEGRLRGDELSLRRRAGCAQPENLRRRSVEIDMERVERIGARRQRSVRRLDAGEARDDGVAGRENALSLRPGTGCLQDHQA